MKTALRVLPGGLCPRCFAEVYFDSDQHGRFIACLCGWEQDIVPERKPCPAADRKAKVDRRRKYGDDVKAEAIRRRVAGQPRRAVASALKVPKSQVDFWCRGVVGIPHTRGRRRDTSTDVLTPVSPACDSAHPTVIIERVF
jgi:hypothetical protein